MKYIITFTILFFSLITNAQSPQLINYQGLAMDNNDRPIKNQSIDVRINFLENSAQGSLIFQETHQVTTSDVGIFSFHIGNGTTNSGSFSAADWANKKYWLEVEADLDGQGIQTIGNAQLVSVPYAMHAETVTNKNDADADPQNELQTLSLNNNELSISNGNKVNLSSLGASPWTTTQGGIAYDQGRAIVTDQQDSVVINPDKIEGYGVNRLKSYSLSAGALEFNDQPQSGNSILAPGHITVNHNFTNSYSEMSNSGITVSTPECLSYHTADRIYFEDTSRYNHTLHNKDSIYFQKQIGLLFPDVSTIKPEYFELKTPGLGTRNFMASGYQSIESDQQRLEMNPSQIRMVEDFPNSFDRLIITGDSMQMTNRAKWKTMDVRSDNSFGGSINLYGPSGGSLVEIGANKNSLFGDPPAGNIVLKDETGVIRASAQIFNQSGSLYVHNDSTYVYNEDGIVAVGKSSPGPFQLIESKGLLGYNPELNAGYVSLSSGNQNQKLAFLGSSDLEPESGRLCLFNDQNDIEKVCAVANQFDGGEIYLIGDESTKFYAGGFDNNGWAYVADSNSFDRAGMKVEEFGESLIYTKDGRFSVQNQLGTDLAVLGQRDLFFFDTMGSAAVSIGQDFAFTNVGYQYLYGRNGYGNVFLGHDKNEGELGPSGNFGIIELLDDEALTRSWMSGTGSIGGMTMQIKDSFGIDKYLVGSLNGTDEAWSIWTGKDLSTNVIINGGSSGNHGSVEVYDENSAVKAGIFVDPSTGDGHVFADVKNFRMDHPESPDKEIWYASLEGPEAGAYCRGTQQLIEGETFVEFPDHFQQVANPETMTVQLTPRFWDTFGLAVTEITQNGFYVKELKGGNGSFDFDWEVKGVRKGFENYAPVKLKSETPQFSHQALKN